MNIICECGYSDYIIERMFVYECERCGRVYNASGVLIQEPYDEW